MNTTSLKRQYIDIRREGVKAMPDFFDDLRAHPNSNAVIRLCLWIIETTKLTDPSLEVTKAAQELVRRRHPAVLYRLKAARERLPHRTNGVTDYRTTVDFAIAVLEAVEHGRCTCHVYADPVFNTSPEMHEDIIIHTQEHPYPYVRSMMCTCQVCRLPWLVEERSDYRFPVYTWRPT